MPNSNKRSFMNRHIWMIYLLAIVSVVAVTYYQLWLGIVLAILLVISFYYSITVERKLFKKQQDYILALSHRIEKVAEVALLKMPIGILLYDEKLNIEWTNPYMNKFAGENDSLVGTPLHRLSEKLDQMMHENKTAGWLHLGEYNFEVTINLEERLLYLFDRTEQHELKQVYEAEKTIMAIIFLDNYEEITQNMDDTIKSILNSKVTSLLNNWASENGLYLKRTSQDRFLAMGTKQILQKLEDTKFEILDKVRELEIEHALKNPITLSIGIGYGDIALPHIGEIAQSGLDLALGRGGDQVVVKDDEGKVRFYGGKTSPMEKRTRVRARVISHALTELVKASDKVIIMGHRSPDMDSIGSSIGILNIARANDVQGYIIFDEDDNITGVQRLVEALKKEELWRHFISADEAETIITSRSLIVVVDTHKPSMVASENLLYKSEHRVIIDHHRRGEDFIDNPTLVYMEPYASSTAELVTELLEYQPSKIKLKMLEATALLAGIIVDTKSFTLRTGSRTFDAASYLRSKGADTVLVQRFMKEDLDVYVRRSKLIEKTSFYRDSIAISISTEDETFDQVIIAQAADTLLTMSGVVASFVISPLATGKIGISARSLGDVNVQVIMEKMGGGGHLTNAATQLADQSLEEVEATLQEVLDEYFEGRN